MAVWFVGLSYVGPAVASAASFPVRIRGGDYTTFQQARPVGTPKVDPTKYDAIVVGGGLAGMTAALYLSDKGKRVLLLEKEDTLGGLAAAGARNDGILYARGAAYWTGAFEEEQKILERIGLRNYKTQNAIAEPIDSYLWNGKLYLGLWEKQSLEKLPASFALFRYAFQKADQSGLIVNQPLEASGMQHLDQISAADWIRGIPRTVGEPTDAEGRAIVARFRADKNLDPSDPMLDVIHLTELYCRSALGATPDQVSALAFLNFYSAEFDARYSSPIGTGHAARKLEAILRDRPKLITIRVNAAVQSIESQVQASTPIRVVKFVTNASHSTNAGKRASIVAARAQYVVFAAQLKLAPNIIRGLRKGDPEKVTAIESVEYAHYAVHNVFTRGHPFRATYDTWTRASDYRPGDFTDVILGRWMDPKINGYQSFRDHKKDPPDALGVFTIYQPFLHPESLLKGMPPKGHLAELARRSANRLVEMFNPILKANWGTKIEITEVESNQWPYSIHITKPGYFTRLAILLRRPWQNIFFAHSNLGTPSFEEALFRGHCAANNILMRIDPKFRQESWSHCPVESR